MAAKSNLPKGIDYGKLHSLVIIGLLLMSASIVVLPDQTQGTFSDESKADRTELKLEDENDKSISNQTQGTVLAECFTGTWCGYCPAAEQALSRLSEEYTREELAIIQWHVGDSYETPDGSGPDRASNFYEVPGYPTTYFDGRNPYIGGSSNPNDTATYNAYKNRIDNELGNQTYLDMSMNGNISNGIGYVSADVSAVDQVTDSNLWIHFVVVEDHDVWDGDYHIRYTAMENLTSEQISIQKGENRSFERDFTIKSEWNTSKLWTVGFVQTHDKEYHSGDHNYYEAEAVQSSMLNMSVVDEENAPSSPQNLHASAGNGYVELDWDAPVSNGGSPLTEYKIYRGNSSGSETLLDSVDPSLQSYNDTTVTNGETYYYYVTAVNSVGESTASNEVPASPELPSISIKLNSGGNNDGWNFISSSLVPKNASMTAILDAPDRGIRDNYDKVMWYQAKTDEWKSYIPTREKHYNTLEKWEITRGIWIHMNSTDILTIKGNRPSTTTIDLYPGWNVVGVPVKNPGNHNLPTEIDKIGRFNSTFDYNIEYLNGSAVDSFEFAPNKACWVHNPTDGKIRWTVSYTSTNGSSSKQ
ncbi:MAG: fibronectin type III domain-containing protein [Candidatus Thermoplasmatota archaeon]|nr:fibronectin type III domain-containing protein [Candidatus Thermoplasmatota archaeon]